MPGMSAIDWERILQRWYQDGHLDAFSKACAARNEEGIVMTRLAKEDEKKSHTPIGTKKNDKALKINLNFEVEKKEKKKKKKKDKKKRNNSSSSSSYSSSSNGGGK